MNGARSSVSEREMGTNRGEDGELNYQERVTVIWTEKVKTMGPCTLSGVERGRGCAEDRVILVDMLNVGMFKRMDKAASNPPIIVVVSDVRALGNRDRNGEDGRSRQTYTRQERFLPMVMSEGGKTVR